MQPETRPPQDNGKSADHAPVRSTTPWWRRLLAGAILGGMAGMAMSTLNLDVLIQYFQHLFVVMTVVGALLGLTRAGKLLWILDGILLAAIFVVGYTPISNSMLRGLERRDALQHADAVVVLGSGFTTEDVIGAHAQDRLLHGLELMRENIAPRMVLTVPGGPAVDWPTLVRGEMQQLGITFDLQQVDGVKNTHDEAVRVAELMHQNGWTKIVLVTHDWHMKRAAAVFEKQHIQVICSPCTDSTFDEENLASPSDRFAALGIWLHETVGWEIYRIHGWI
ncbi:MAG: YdcF family protein [Tepidisphaeraceae bacterium]